MNERIKELAGMALDQAVPQTWTTLTAYDLDKFTGVFAELIVRECCQKLENDGMVEVAMEMKEHFGVE